MSQFVTLLQVTPFRNKSKLKLGTPNSQCQETCLTSESFIYENFIINTFTQDSSRILRTSKYHL